MVGKDKARKTYYIDEKVKICDGSFKHLVVRGYKSSREAEYDLSNQIEKFKQRWAEKLEENDLTSDTLESIIKEYLNNYVQENEETTTETVRVALEIWVIKYFDNKTVKEIFTEDSIIKWKDYLTSSDIICANRKNMILRHFRSILARGINRSLIPASATKLNLFLNRIKDKEIKKEMTIWTVKLFKQFYATFDKDDRWYVFFVLYFALGCRISEIRGLQVQDFNFDNKSLAVYKQVNTRKKGGVKGGKWELKITKTKAGNREVYIPDNVCELVKKYIDVLQLKNDDLLFFGKTPVAENTVRGNFNRHSQKAGLPHIRIHDVRHSSLTYQFGLCKDVKDVVTVAQRGGHANPNELLKTYLAKLPKQQKKLVKSMNIL
jgi:integrase